jgi:hypothetical protein
MDMLAISWRLSGVLALALAALLGTGCPDCAAATRASPPPVTVSPLPGTPDAMPSTQISFLGAPASELHDISVSGSRSGHHAGRLESYTSAPGGSFLPARPFQAGERVTVSAVVGSGETGERISTTFEIAHPYALPRERPRRVPAGGPADVQRFHSIPGLHPAAVHISAPAAAPALGDIFIAPNAGPGQAGTMILEPDGQLVWFKPGPPRQTAMDLRVQRFDGQPVLTWWQGLIIDGHGEGQDEIYSSSYRPLASVRAGNGLRADLHEFDLIPGGRALITTYEPIHWDLSSVGGPRRGLLNDCAVQEIDIKTGLVMFEWHALGHVGVRDSHTTVPHHEGWVYDFFHINSIQQQSNGNLLITARNTWAVYMVDARTGRVLWSVGGRHSSFALGRGVRFAWEHDAELLPDGELTLFDDEDYPRAGRSSRALRIALDFADRRATLVHELTHPGTIILSPSQGNVQTLPDGAVVVGWGQRGGASEFSPAGQLTFDLQLPTGDGSYRAYIAPWSATPSGAPALSAAPGAGATTVAFASWNGATRVAAWRVTAGSSPTALSAVTQFPRSGFETRMVVPTSEPYLAVQALGPEGQLLASSRAVRR